MKNTTQLEIEDQDLQELLRANSLDIDVIMDHVRRGEAPVTGWTQNMIAAHDAQKINLIAQVKHLIQVVYKLGKEAQ